MIKRKKRKKYSWMHLIILFIIVYIAAIFVNQRRLMNDMKVKKAKLEAEIGALSQEIESLSLEVENSDSLEFIEKVAREELGLVKPREIIYIDKDKIKNLVFDLFKK